MKVIGKIENSVLRANQEQGFTLIELSMVILVVAILAAVAVPQFIDFRIEARNAATQNALSALRTGIANQTMSMQLRCGSPAGKFPKSASVIAGDITDASNQTAGWCATTWPASMSAAEKQFVSGGVVPNNPWSAVGTTIGTIAANTITACSGNGCDPVAHPDTDCAGTAGGMATAAKVGGWCYDESTGKIWANSANNNQATLENQF